MGFIEKSLSLRKDARTFILGWFNPRILAAEKTREDHNVALRAHWPDDAIDVYELIYENWEPPPEIKAEAKKKNSIVFIDPEMGVDWISDAPIEEKAAECASIADSIGAKRCHHLPQEQILEFKRLVGQAVVNAIRGNEKQSCKLAEEAAQFLKDRTVERSRVWTLCSAHWLLAAFLLAFAILLGLPQAYDLIENIPIGLYLAAVGGLVGAYLSVLQKAGSGEWDAASGYSIHALEVFTKFVAGTLFGALTFAIAQSVHAPPSIKSLTPDSYSLFLFGLAAGLFERLIPKMISSYSEKYTKEKL
jgi:hypothetical protein